MTTETIEVTLEDQNEIKELMKILNSNSKNFDKNLDILLLKEKEKFNLIQFQYQVLLKMLKKMEIKHY